MSAQRMIVLALLCKQGIIILLKMIDAIVQYFCCYKSFIVLLNFYATKVRARLMDFVNCI